MGRLTVYLTRTYQLQNLCSTEWDLKNIVNDESLGSFTQPSSKLREAHSVKSAFFIKKIYLFYRGKEIQQFLTSHKTHKNEPTSVSVQNVVPIQHFNQFSIE